MAKISNFIIGLIIVSLFTSILTLAIANLSSNYGVSFDNSSFDTYNKLSELNTNMESIANETSSIETQTGVLDVIGDYFTGGYKALLTAKNSFSVFNTMLDESIDSANLGETGQLFKIAIGSIILVFIFIGVILSAIVKKDL